MEPPYDDQLTGPALWLVGYAELPFDEPGPRLAAEPDQFGPQPTSRQDLPDPERWAASLVQAVIEVLVGRRPAAQLQEVTTQPAFAGLMLTARHSRWQARGGPPPAVRSVRLGEPADGIVEAAVTTQLGDRHVATAVRLEGYDGRWRCTALHIG